MTAMRTTETLIDGSPAESQRLFEAITSPEHKTDLTLPAVKSPSAAERATWRTA